MLTRKIMQYKMGKEINLIPLKEDEWIIKI